jgi:choline dehydrogenase
MHSGIGPAEHLLKAGIRPVVDRAQVGRNLQDHLTIRVLHASEEKDLTYDLRRVDRAIFNVLRAIVTKSGPATAFPLEGGAFIRSRPELEAPDLQIHFFPGVPVTRGFRYPFQKPLPDTYEGYGFCATICQLRPESRGDITLRSADPFAPPVIRANYLSTPGDRQTLREGVKITRNVLNQKAFAHMSSIEMAPGPAVTTDEGIDHFVAKNAGTVFHPVGTCRMGVDHDSVVDEELRVRGVEGLRVADASIMPLLVSSNTNAPTIMIAEKAAQMILGAP